jgi:RNA polymerase sigma factor (sigma-70 family)
MKVAIDFHRAGSAFSREGVGPTRHSQHTAQRLLSKKRPQARPENRSGDWKGQKLDSSSFSEAIRLAQQGDAPAFEIIYQQHSARVYALCLRMLCDPVQAEDLVQEVFIRLFRKIHTYRGESAFSTWLHRLTANLVLMHLRRKKPISISLDDIDGSDEGDDRSQKEIGAPDPPADWLDRPSHSPISYRAVAARVQGNFYSPRRSGLRPQGNCKDSRTLGRQFKVSIAQGP